MVCVVLLLRLLVLLVALFVAPGSTLNNIDVVSSSKPQFLFHSVMLSPLPPPDTAEGRETIVIMHGLLGSAKNFHNVAKLLQKAIPSVDIVVFDLRSHGRSFANLGDLHFDYNLMAADVIHSLQKLKLHDNCPLHVVGHSMGGKVAAATCLLSQRDHPAIDIRSVALLDISPVQYSADEFTDVLAALDFLEGTVGIDRQGSGDSDGDGGGATHGRRLLLPREEVVAGIGRAFPEARDEAFRLFLQSNLVQVAIKKEKEEQQQQQEGRRKVKGDSTGSTGAWSWRFSVPGISRSRRALLDWPLLSSSSSSSASASASPSGEGDNTQQPQQPQQPQQQFRRPVLLLKGGDSSLVKSVHLDSVQRQFPLFSLQVVKGAGHWLHVEKPAETVEKIVQFIRDARAWHDDKE
jgi:pimeloyl-ACP methyl ester carboxylesterase